MSEDWQALIPILVALAVAIALFLLMPLLLRSGIPLMERLSQRLIDGIGAFMTWYFNLWTPKSSGKADIETSVSVTVRPPTAKASVHGDALARWVYSQLDRPGSPPVRSVLSSALSDPATTSQMQAEIQKALERIDHLEQRFPDATEVDKYASVNDGIHAVQIRNLDDRLDALEASIDKRLDTITEKTMTPWKVFGVVSAVLILVLALATGLIALAEFGFNDEPQPSPSPSSTAQ